MKPYDAGNRLLVTWVEASGWKSLLIVAPSVTSTEASAAGSRRTPRSWCARAGRGPATAHGTERQRSREASSSSVVPRTPALSTTSRAVRRPRGAPRRSGSTTSSRHPPPSSRVSRDDLRARRDARTELLGPREVGAVDAVLRAVRAARDARPAPHAVGERDALRRRAKVSRPPSAAPRTRSQRSWALDERVGLDAEHRGGRVVVRSSSPAQSSPVAVHPGASHASVGRAQQDGGVDDRAAADADAVHDHDVAQRGLPEVAAQPDLGHPQQVARAATAALEVLAGQPATLLEHGDRAARLRVPQRGDAAAEPGADDRDVDVPPAHPPSLARARGLDAIRGDPDTRPST